MIASALHFREPPIWSNPEREISCHFATTRFLFGSGAASERRWDPSRQQTIYGGIVTECWDSVTNDFQCCANASVGNHPAGITPCRATMPFSTNADETDQFCPPQSSF